MAHSQSNDSQEACLSMGAYCSQLFLTLSSFIGSNWFNAVPRSWRDWIPSCLDLGLLYLFCLQPLVVKDSVFDCHSYCLKHYRIFFRQKMTAKIKIAHNPTTFQIKLFPKETRLSLENSSSAENKMSTRNMNSPSSLKWLLVNNILFHF